MADPIPTSKRLGARAEVRLSGAHVRSSLPMRAVVFYAALSAAGCRSQSLTQANPSAQPAVAAPSSEQVLLTGTFERVARAASGTARIVRRGSAYELRLSDVTVAQEGMVRVYLVGHPRAASTRLVDDTEMKYDMAELERGASEQRIELPGEPDPALRSVVLFYPAFGVNLAYAPLHPPMNGP